MRRIEQLLGAPLANLAEENLRRLVDGAVTEDFDLEFKEALYGGADPSNKRDLAGDVAALANSRGGVIILGVREASTIAVELSPVDISGEEEVRMRQIIASNTAPVPRITVHRVERQGSDGTGWYVIAVEQSPLAPHAVRSGDSLRYPRREGPGIRWLSESEVADAYMRRGLLAEQRGAALASLATGVHRLLAARGDEVWLSMAMVPHSPGSELLTTARLEASRAIFTSGEVPTFIQSTLRYHVPRVRVGHRRAVLVFGESGEDGRGYAGGGELHTNGSGALLARVGDGMRRNVERPADSPLLFVHDERLAQEAIVCLYSLARNADECGAGTLGDVEVSLLHQPRGLLLAHARQHGIESTWSDRTIIDTTPTVHTIDLRSCLESPTELCAAAALCLEGIFQSFGVLETPQLQRDGTVRMRYWADQQRAYQVADRFGIAKSEESVSLMPIF